MPKSKLGPNNKWCWHKSFEFHNSSWTIECSLTPTELQHNCAILLWVDLYCLHLYLQLGLFLPFGLFGSLKFSPLCRYDTYDIRGLQIGTILAFQLGPPMLAEVNVPWWAAGSLFGKAGRFIIFPTNCLAWSDPVLSPITTARSTICIVLSSLEGPALLFWLCHSFPLTAKHLHYLCWCCFNTACLELLQIHLSSGFLLQGLHIGDQGTGAFQILCLRSCRLKAALLIFFLTLHWLCNLQILRIFRLLWRCCGQKISWESKRGHTWRFSLQKRLYPLNGLLLADFTVLCLEPSGPSVAFALAVLEELVFFDVLADFLPRWRASGWLSKYSTLFLTSSEACSGESDCGSKPCQKTIFLVLHCNLLAIAYPQSDDALCSRDHINAASCTHIGEDCNCSWHILAAASPADKGPQAFI